MTGALGDIEYLARSENRLVVLRTLATEPMGRDALREETGISRQTFARIVSELQERGWIERIGVDYRATTLGAYLAWEFEAFRDRVESADAIADAIADLPGDAAALGVEAFVGSDVVRATPADPLAPVRQAASYIQAADAIRICAGAVTQETLSANLAAVEAGQRFEAVFDRRSTEVLRSDPALGTLVTSLLAHDTVALYTVSDELDYSVGLTDTTVAFGLSDERGAPTTYLRTDDDRVVEWATTLFADLVARGERLTAEEFD